MSTRGTKPKQGVLLTVYIAPGVPDMSGVITIWKMPGGGYSMFVEDEYGGDAPSEVQTDQQAVLFWLGKIREMLQMFAS